MRDFSGKLLLRLDPETHRKLAVEAFETGRSINQLCIGAIIIRNELKKYDPWKEIEKSWENNKNVKEEDVAKVVAKALLPGGNVNLADAVVGLHLAAQKADRGHGKAFA